jgi:hypothetical protein
MYIHNLGKFKRHYKQHHIQASGTCIKCNIYKFKRICNFGISVRVLLNPQTRQKEGAQGNKLHTEILRNPLEEFIVDYETIVDMQNFKQQNK